MRPVTPRAGKPVEVAALWANALAILADLETRLGNPEDAKRRAGEAKRAPALVPSAVPNNPGDPTIVVDPEAVICRIVLFPLSETKRFPVSSMVTAVDWKGRVLVPTT